MNQKIVVPMERLISKLILIAFVCNSNLFAVIASGDSIHISGIKETYRSNDIISVSLLNTTSKKLSCSCSLELLKDSSWIVIKEDVLQRRITKSIVYMNILPNKTREFTIDLGILNLIYFENFGKCFYRLKFSTIDSSYICYSSQFAISP